MKDVDRAVEDPETLARIAEILQQQWDPGRVVCTALHGGDDFYQEQAVIVAAMLSADARDTEVQRYLRQLEQQAGPVTLHPVEARHAIAAAAWRAARGL